MANDPTLPATGEKIDTFQQSDASQRQKVAIMGAGDNEQDVIGALTETAPGSDTASSGLNGRLQRIAQRIASLIGQATGPATGTQASIAGSASAGTLIAANSARKGGSIYNDSTAVLYVLCDAGKTVTSSVFSVPLNPGAYWELPVCQGGVYTGIVTGLWAAATGNARVTEFT